MGNLDLRRAILAISALGLGALGVAFLVRFVWTAEERAMEGFELVDVYLVQAPVPSGTPAAELGQYISQQAVPAQNRAPDAVVELGELVDLVATVDLQPGEQLLRSRFDVPDEVRTIFGGEVPVPNGLLEVTVRSSAERAVGAQIAPGDRVAVLASFSDYVSVVGGQPVAARRPSNGDQDDGEAVTGVLLRQALVTNIQGTTELFDLQDETGRSREAPTIDLLVTLAVEPVDATRLVFASEYGTVWFALDGQLGTDAPSYLAFSSDVFSDDGRIGTTDTADTSLNTLRDIRESDGEDDGESDGEPGDEADGEPGGQSAGEGGPASEAGE